MGNEMNMEVITLVFLVFFPIFVDIFFLMVVIRMELNQSSKEEDDPLETDNIIFIAWTIVDERQMILTHRYSVGTRSLSFKLISPSAGLVICYSKSPCRHSDRSIHRLDLIYHRVRHSLEYLAYKPRFYTNPSGEVTELCEANVFGRYATDLLWRVENRVYEIV